MGVMLVSTPGHGAEPMTCAFVSCDVVGHSRESSVEVQRQRIAGINEIVRQVIVRRGPADVVWASGGDGGHVAFLGSDFAQDALDLIIEWRRWSIREKASLRIAANCGD